MKLSEPSSRASFGLIVLVLVASAIVSVEVGSYYYLRSRSPSANSDGSGSGGNSSGVHAIYLHVNTLINYGNATSRWYNESSVLPSWNFYDLTLFVADGNVQAQYYPYLNAHYIISINGVRNDGDGIHCTFCWTLWVYCVKDSAWAISTVGADLIKLAEGGAYSWYYQDTSASPWKSPVAGAPTVSFCS